MSLEAVEVKVDGLRKDYDKHAGENREDFERVWQAIDRLTNRPPVWCTVVIGVLCGLSGLLAGLKF
ncbi:MAG: hypothetical protein AB1510_02105 [Bacillota bacterium]